MASPIGHALVGIGLAALSVPIIGVSPSAAVWVGSVIASGLPDLDFAGTLLGISSTRVHRRATHSLVVLGIVVLLATGLSSRLERFAGHDLVLVWSLALLSHPIVDLLATGPQAARKSFGLPLFWPLWSRRWHLRRPLLRPPSLEQYRSGSIWGLLLPELTLFGPLCLGMALLGGLI
jgi:membrane-bound metal-dependent hydrolase YbcI (DUF457 family)